MTEVVSQAIKNIELRGTAHLSIPSQRFHCSGVLPYCLYGNACYFLLGKTRNGKLLTYTGKSEPDRDKPTMFEPPVVTGAREFTEESLGSIISYDQCLEACRLCDNTHVIISSTPKNTLCYTFLIEVPYRRHYSTCFSKVRGFLDFIGVRDHHLCEFTEIKAVCFETLNTKVRYAWRAAGKITLDSEWNKLQNLVPHIEISEGAHISTTPFFPEEDRASVDTDTMPVPQARCYRISPSTVPARYATYAFAASHGTNHSPSRRKCVAHRMGFFSPPGLVLVQPEGASTTSSTSSDWRTRVTSCERPQMTTHKLLTREDHSEEEEEEEEEEDQEKDEKEKKEEKEEEEEEKKEEEEEEEEEEEKEDKLNNTLPP